MCGCPGDCEGGPECLDDEGAPLPVLDRTRLVALRIGDALLLRAILRLPESVTLQDAAVVREPDGVPVLVVTVDMPDAPSGAASVDVTYMRRTSVPDPVQVTGFRYFREDGSEIEPELASGRRPEWR
jgi:hypothetical protein